MSSDPEPEPDRDPPIGPPFPSLSVIEVGCSDSISDG